MSSTSRQMAKNSSINLLGQGLPLLVALYCMPKILQNLGEERLGVLALAWMFIGYFTLFDLGLGRAVTKELAYWFPKDLRKANGVFWTGVISSSLLGVLAGLIFWGLTPFFLRYLNVPEVYFADARATFYAIAWGIPFVVSSVSLRGVLEARSQFVLLSLVQIPLGVLNYLIPLLLSGNRPEVALIVEFLIFIRGCFWLTMVFMVWRDFPGGITKPQFSLRQLKELLAFGGWITVTNLISPLVGYIDRMLIGAMVSTAAVAYYSTPYEMVMKLWIIPGAIMGVLFPTLSALESVDRQRLNDLLVGGSKIIFLIMFPIGFLLSTFSYEILTIWLGKNFASESAVILRWFGPAIIVSTVGFMPSAFLQARGRPDILAKSILLQMPFYLTALLILTRKWGAEGAAITWFLRTVVDVSLLYYFSFRHLGRHFPLSFRWGYVAFPYLAFVIVHYISNFNWKVSFFATVDVGFALAFWLGLLSARERQWLKALVRRRTS